MKTDLQSYLDFVRPYYDSKDQAHDYQHILRIVRRLDHLSEGMTITRPEMLCFLATFHGLWPLWRGDDGFRNAALSFLTGIGWSEGELEEAALKLHRHGKDPQTVEEKFVHDANYIELVGAFGVAKAFTVGGARGQTLEETADIFEHNLGRVEFRTPVGRRLAEEGRVYANQFLARLREEL